MNKENIIDYVAQTPHNPNKNAYRFCYTPIGQYPEKGVEITQDNYFKLQIKEYEYNK